MNKGNVKIVTTNIRSGDQCIYYANNTATKTLLVGVANYLFGNFINIRPENVNNAFIPRYLGLGNGIVPPTVNDTKLTSEYLTYIPNLTSRAVPQRIKVSRRVPDSPKDMPWTQILIKTFVPSYALTPNDDDRYLVTELGLFATDGLVQGQDQTCLARVVLPDTRIEKTNQVTLDVSWTLVIQSHHSEIYSTTED